MASSTAISKVPLFRTLAARGYASQPAVAAAIKTREIQTTTLPNKLIVTSTETGTPISRVSITFRAGARNETYENQGVSHYMRIAAGLTTKHATTFGITRNVQQVGGNLFVTSDREATTYVIEVTRDHLETALQFLEKTATGQVFKPWEIEDSTNRVKVDLANIPDHIRAIELLHRAAYRTGLGNSIFCQKHKVGKISSETLQNFYQTNFTANNASVSGINIDHNTLTGFAQNLQLPTGEGKINQSNYHGGVDLRLEKGGRNAAVAVATSGGSWSSIQEGVAFMVLQQVAGVTPNVKYGNSAGVISKSIQSAAPNTAVCALNAGYTDSGLFGFVVNGPAKESGAAVEAGIKSLKSATITDDDIARGKAQLKSLISFNYESDPNLLIELGLQSMIFKGVLSLKDALSAVDAIQASDVKNVARKLSNKVSIGAVGYLEHVPYAADFN
ncbi:hypothetical protein PVAND_006961 [Polypedilum vanderplanki]|uniref:Cytochrome b-c1 complex subunit 2, mitochondrial n=1 Tax=Polypedilum vanderplanki TaxID=319348 RepID=A0A9J6C4S5_POLVA|nr:hypothetical protein PVAND_006961 [Polypedilum vanderplanki]